MTVLHTLPIARKRQLKAVLKASSEAAADFLHVPREHVRANLFALDSDGKIRIAPEFSHNMMRGLSRYVSAEDGPGAAALRRPPGEDLFR